jgi:ubiquinone/menaquinone biosynthesis C-methylase UbiE
MVDTKKKQALKMNYSKSAAELYGKIAGPVSVLAFSDSLDNFFLKYMPDGADILEIGCGPGLQAIDIVKRRPDVKLVASDFSDNFVQLGIANWSQWIQQNRQIDYGSTTPSLTFVQANAMDLSSFSDNSFDGIYSITAIKHFPDPIHCIRECIRCLKPGGRLLFSEFYQESSIETVNNFVQHSSFPGFLKPFIARIFHLPIRNSLSIEEVKNWLPAINIPDSQKELHILKDYPAWVFTAIK